MLPVLTRRGTTWPTMDPFDRDFGRMLHQLCGDCGTELSETAAIYPVDVWEDDDNLYVDAEVPGFKNDDIEITIEQGTLQITATRQTEERPSKLVSERRFNRYHRAFTLPTAVEDDKIQARCESGVLHLTLPKRAEVKPRRIKVN